MMKTWNIPSLEELDVKFTANGVHIGTEEGQMGSSDLYTHHCCATGGDHDTQCPVDCVYHRPCVGGECPS